MSSLGRFAAILVGVGFCLGGRTAAAAVVVVVSAKKPVVSLSKNEVLDIFLGRTSRFPDGSPAVPLDQAEGSAVRDAFYNELAGKSPAQMKAHWSKIIFTGRGQPPRQVANGAELKKRLAENPNVIGYLEESLVDDTVKVLLSP